jgi:multidrug efflux pump subunit AcrA (membrane-fusion protein)
MKWLKIVSIFMVVGVIVFLSFSCSSKSDSSNSTKTQISTVQKGSISIEVTGTGNLALSHTEDMAFGVAGTVDEILVSESQSIKKGVELAKLDTAVWDKQVKALQTTLDNARRTLSTRENDVTKAQRQVTVKENALPQAEYDIVNAENNINQVTEIKEAQDNIDKITSDLNFAKQMRQAATIDSFMNADPIYWNLQITGLTAKLKEANTDLADLKSDSSVNASTNLSLQIASLKLQLEQKKKALADANTAVDDAKAAVTNAQMLRGDAEQAVKDAQADLDEAKSLSPIIYAPFDGFITKINVKGGDEVLKGKVAMQLADPNQFEANILVTEKDIFSVKLGGEATVALDALSGLSFPAKITKIAPLATVSQGVVNYKVTVELTSLKPTIAGLSGQRSNMFSSGAISPSGTPPSGFSGGAPPTGANFPASTALPFTGGQLPSGVPLPSGTNGNFTTSSFAGAISNITLKDGLTATVTIIIQKKDNILLVPNRALSRQGKDTVVKIQTGETTENRIVKTGLSDLQNTEITEGLKEGDQIVITTTSSSSTSSSGQNIGGGAFRMVGPR